MVVLVIICILAGVYFVGGSGGGSTRADGKGKTIVGGAIYRARDEVCRSNLNQVRQAVQLKWTTDDAYPATLDETRIGQDFYQCAIGKEHYEYDASTGKVKCVHPGHEKY